MAMGRGLGLAMVRMQELKHNAQLELEYRKQKKRRDWGKQDIRSLARHKKGSAGNKTGHPGEGPHLNPEHLHLSHESYRHMQQLHLMRAQLKESLLKRSLARKESEGVLGSMHEMLDHAREEVQTEQ